MQKHPAHPVERRSHTPAPSSRIPEWGAYALFITSLAVCAVMAVRYFSYVEPKQPKRVKALPMVDVFSLSRTPTVDAGRFRYAVLGYGQDSDSGEQIVWIRSITTNRVGGFKVGDALFSGPVSVQAIEEGRLTLAYQGQGYEVPIQP